MFPPFPGFEDLPLHVKVEWQEQTRPVLVQFQTWPEPHQAVLVCRFEDEPTNFELLILQGNGTPHLAGNPYKLLLEIVTFDISTRAPTTIWKIKEQRLEKLKSIVQRAFTGDNFRIGRFLELPNLPDEPRIALWSSSGSVWFLNWQWADAIPFEFWLSPPTLNHHSVKEQLFLEWNDPESDARFAWQWAQWNNDERRAQLTGFRGDLNDIERVMKWVLTISTSLWQLDDGWQWSLYPEYETRGWLVSQPSCKQPDKKDLLDEWCKCLLKFFAPQWRGEWLQEHSCVSRFWGERVLGEVRVDTPPTMHEQLEARLELRAWLQDKATPEEIEKLMAG